MSFAISISRLHCRLGDDTEVFGPLTATIPAALVGLVGDNGVGKSTLATILAGLPLPPGMVVTGTVTGAAPAVSIDQLLPHAEASVDAALGIADRRAALLRTLAGEATAHDFEVIGDDWDIEEQALSALAEAGLTLEPSDLDRPISTFSGGEAMRVGLARAALAGGRWLILDEPSNNLDAAGRARLTALLNARSGPTLVISHDRELLEEVDAIVEMTDELRVYGGGFSDYEDMVAAEEEAKRQALVDAKRTLAVEKRQRIELETKLARADRKAATDNANKRRPKIVMNGLTNSAQKSAAKRRGDKAHDEAEAKGQVQAARDELRQDPRITVHLPDTAVHPGRRVLEIDTAALARPLSIVGPERIRLTGPNGAGKSTLLTAITAHAEGLRADTARAEEDGGSATRAGSAAARLDRLFPGLDVNVHVPVAHLDQQYRLPPGLSIMEAVRERTPGLTKHRVHEMMAAMGLRAGRTEQVCSTLSGGERFRVALARALLQEPAPQLLVLDEPGNNLDLSSLAALVSALEGFGGAMLVVTHDERLAADLGLESTWDVEELRMTDLDAFGIMGR
ncbi:ATPase subunit of ABC transporter with duplicated ATPase domains [Brevibacterium sanguinis]|uniref:ATPase subunit of ABC transporter with duplicated ATPase domains n=2 Tax=Brevibacterium TaxID=1696 RepID=A0A366IGR7_9MICO|nr:MULTISPECIES: ATP-binding cassette domain-containing protein [Brevibacterium]RBP63966.1 ATPase subunit of ABC transporter with duplicated ATPase domains [Brevibacterium sanguinis]RBP70759.1 ATPase subunit of ABC transporter with duplicated ATPase domains [Brevibacterium celere]